MLTKRDRHPPAVVIGLGVNGLGTVRSLARRGVRCIAITAGRGDPSEYTKYCEKVVLPEIANPNALVSCLQDVAKQFDGRGIVFPSGDLSLAAVSSNRDVLLQSYHLPMPDHAVVELILDKSRFYAYAQDRGLPVARTYFPKSIEEVNAIADEVAYPCLIKPSIATPAWRDQGLKLLSADNRTELLQQFQRGWEIHKNLVIQEVTPGPDSSLHFSLAFMDGSGECRAMFTGRKLRQYVPHYGISSLAESLWNADVDRESRRIFQQLNYSGYGSVEFKRHALTGEMLITEVTGRTWYPHALSEYCGINLPFIAYSESVLGTRIDVPTAFPDHVKWIDEVGDTLSAFWYWRRGELSLRGWIESYQGVRHWALAVADDPKPFMVLVARLTKQAVLWPLRVLLLPVRRLLRSRSRRGSVAASAAR